MVSTENRNEEKNQYFASLYAQYYENIFHYLVSHVNSREIAEELASDVFFRVYKNLESYDEERSFILTWLYTITNNRLKNFYRSRRVEVCYEELEPVFVTSVDDLDEKIIEKEKNMFLEKHLQKLKHRERKIVILKYYYEMNSREIGKEMGLTSGNVRIILKRTLKRMKQNIEEDANCKFMKIGEKYGRII